MHRFDSESLTTADDVIDRLAARLPQMRQRLRPKESIDALGLDSIDLVELLCAVESEFHVTVRDDDLRDGAATIAELAEVIRRRCHERQVRS